MKKTMTALLFALALLACGSATQIEKSWLDPVQHTRYNSMKKVWVIVFAQSQASRRAAEDALARNLGPSAVPSYNHALLADSTGNADAMVEALIKDGFEGAIVTRLIDQEKERSYVPGRVSYPFYGSFTSYYSYSYSGFVETDYFVEDHKYYIETNVYYLKDEKLLWSAVTKATHGGNLEKVMQGFATVLVQQMENDGFKN